MKLNKKDFENIGDAINYAIGIADEFRDIEHLPFGSDDFILEVAKGEIQHIWFHCWIMDAHFRLSITETCVALFRWVEKKGWTLIPFDTTIHV